jgi:hypothetical protein
MWKRKINIEKVNQILKPIVFLCGLALLLIGLNRLMLPEFCPPGIAATSSFTAFYQLPKDSIDVVFLGASRAACSFDPVQMERAYGIHAWNLGFDQQNLLVSYYWLKEALRIQSPSTVVLEVKLLFPYIESDALNSAEESTRKGIDNMHWSTVKQEVIEEICRIDPSQARISYYLPLYRFHDRWRYLDANDFTWRNKTKEYDRMGFVPFDFVNGDLPPFRPFTKESIDAAWREAPVPVMYDYLERLTALCREKDIRLILVNVPYPGGTPGKAKMVQQYAEQRGIAYYDFCGEDLYQAADYDFSVDQMDATHPNIRGAVKLTDFLGRVLKGDKTCCEIR